VANGVARALAHGRRVDGGRQRQVIDLPGWRAGASGTLPAHSTRGNSQPVRPGRPVHGGYWHGVLATFGLERGAECLEIAATIDQLSSPPAGLVANWKLDEGRQ